MTNSSMPWVKVYTDFLDDRKIARLSDRVKLRFIQIILIAGECDSEGYLIDSAGPMTCSDIAWRLRVLDKDVVEDVAALIQAELIEEVEVDGQRVMLVTNFAKRQGRSQTTKREQWRSAQQRHRQGQVDDTPQAADDKPDDKPDDTQHDTPDDTHDESNMSHTDVMHDTAMSNTYREEEEEEIEEINSNGANAPAASQQVDLSLSVTPGGRVLYALLKREKDALKRRMPKNFPTVACCAKFRAAERRLSAGELKNGIQRAMEKNITSIPEITDFVAKWGLSPPKANGTTTTTAALGLRGPEA